MTAVQPAASEAMEGLRLFLARAEELRRRQAPGTSDLSHVLSQSPPFPYGEDDEAADIHAAQARTPLDPLRLRKVVAALTEPLRRTPPPVPTLNIWSIAGLKRDELRNAAVLAWFLNPYESHGLGPAFLTAFLQEVSHRLPDWPRVPGDLSFVSVVTEEWPLGSTSDRVDISIEGPGFVLFVEVKIDALEGRDQLSRYVTQARRKVQATGRAHGGVVYLSPRPPRDVPPGVAVITWREVASALSALPCETAGRSLASQFARHVRAFF